eukprot:1416289-Amphidinium_carterae.1
MIVNGKFSQHSSQGSPWGILQEERKQHASSSIGGKCFYVSSALPGSSLAALGVCLHVREVPGVCYKCVCILQTPNPQNVCIARDDASERSGRLALQFRQGTHCKQSVLRADVKIGRSHMAKCRKRGYTELWLGNEI